MKKFFMKHVREGVAVGIVGVMLVAAFALVPTFLKIPRAFAASGGNVSGFAWSETIGWVSFNSSSDGSATTYGVNINTTTGAFSGYAWSENIGWINFSGVQMNMSTGKVTGSAQAVAAQDGWDGVLKMSDDTIPSWNGNGVKMNLTTGAFSGYAWGGGDSGAVAGVIGWLDFGPDGGFGGVTGPGSCNNGANNPPSCNACTLPLVWNPGTSSCITPPTPTATITLNGSSATTVNKGNTANIVWNSTNAINCFASNNAGDSNWTGVKWTPGSLVTSVFNTLGTYTYSVYCYDGSGNNSPLASATATVVAAPPTVTLTANPTSVLPGGSATLSWTTSANATSCSATSNPVQGVWNGSKAVGGPNTQSTGALAKGSYTYYMTCTDSSSGLTSPQVSASVLSQATASLSVSNCTIGIGASTCPTPFTWSTNGAVAPSLYNATQLVTYSTTPPETNASYVINHGSNTIQVKDGATVLASATPAGYCIFPSTWDLSSSTCIAPTSPSGTLTASPTSVPINGKATLKWTSSNATSCTASGGSTGWKSAVTLANYTNGSWQTTGLPAGTYTYTLTCSKSGYANWVGTATVKSQASVCGNGVCDGAETILSCPVDCKTTVEQF